MSELATIVLVHGAWTDGSGWRAAHAILTNHGYAVSVVQNPLTSLEADVAATRRVIARQTGPVVLVGHSYGGAVITQVADDPTVAGLVYLAAFVPDIGESAFGLLPQDGTPPPIEPSADGFAFFGRGAFLKAFAQGIETGDAAFMVDAQVPISLAGATTPLTVAGWRTKPSWYLVSADDHIIPPEAQRRMAARAGATVAEVEGGHLAFMSRPDAASALIEQAAASVSRSTATKSRT